MFSKKRPSRNRGFRSPEESRVHAAIDPHMVLPRMGCFLRRWGLISYVPDVMCHLVWQGRLMILKVFLGFSKIDTVHPFGGKRRLSHWKSGDAHYGWICPEIVRSSCQGADFSG